MFLDTDPAEDLANKDHAEEAAQGGDQPAGEERPTEIDDRITAAEHADGDETARGSEASNGSSGQRFFGWCSG